MNLQNTELKNAISAAALKSQYDACVKRLLGNKNILAHILVRTVKEFKGMQPEDVLPQIIVNIKAQKNEPKKYPILNRAVFYVSRLISSQKERDFENSNYQDIKQVYSIWICMNMPQNIMSHIHLTKDDLIGSYEWDGRLDFLNIIIIGLANKLPEDHEMYELHRLLCALLSQELSTDKKLDIISSEYNIPVEMDLK